MPSSLKFFEFKAKIPKIKKSLDVKHEVISPNEYRLFVISKNEPTSMICTAPSLLSCINVIFLSDQVGASYHVNCGDIQNREVPCESPRAKIAEDKKTQEEVILRTDVLKTIFHFFESNRVPSSEIKVILALPGPVEIEKMRADKTIHYLAENGLLATNISAVYEASSYSVSSRGEHGIAIRPDSPKFKNG